MGYGQRDGADMDVYMDVELLKYTKHSLLVYVLFLAVSVWSYVSM